MCYQKQFEDLLEGVFLQSSAFTAYAVGKRPCEENDYTVFVTLNELKAISDEMLASVLQQNVLTYFTLRKYEDYIEEHMPKKFVRLYHRFRKLQTFVALRGHKVDRDELFEFLSDESAEYEESLTRSDIDFIKRKYYDR